jgi:hypothetical protein
MKFSWEKAWKNYNGLFILAAMFAGFGLTMALAYAAEKVEEVAPAAAPVAEVKKLEDKSRLFLEGRGKSYVKQLEEVRAKRRLVEDGLKELERKEAELKGKIEEVDAIFKDMNAGKLWIVDSKDAAK